MKNPLTDKVFPVFLSYTLPTILGMISVASASIIDGIFVGNLVGHQALAAVNMTIPLTSLVFGIGIMLCIGGSVKSGKALGEKDRRKASDIFTKTLITIFALSLLMAVLGIIFLSPLVELLGANEQITGDVQEYLSYLLIFIPFFLTGFAFSYFARVDGHPGWASASMVISAVSNVLLDWLLISKLELGLTGAALATGISQSLMFFVLIPHFFTTKAKIKFVLPKGSWKVVIEAALNGSSEFLNEISAGIVTFIFNRVIIQRMGVDGVAAFTIINYILFIGLMVCYSVSDALQPLVSINFGAKKSHRISSFMQSAVLFNLGVGILIIVALQVFPEMLINLFLNEGAQDTAVLAQRYISWFWPAFLFNGINIAFSGYFTAMHRPLHSAVIAVVRSLIFPVLFVSVMIMLMDDIGIFIAIPMAEAVTMLICLGMFAFNKPQALCNHSEQLS
ncbi:MATE family efflux transporter [Marinilabiliaceae bacterium JC017]|nr:MATE family efflux transporter [Marinilabiliaceae bacterium JC017]